jgi:hypothetical protein
MERFCREGVKTIVSDTISLRANGRISMNFRKYGFAMMALSLSVVIMSSHVLGRNGNDEGDQAIFVDADTLVAGIDDCVGKRIETCGNIVHVCGVSGMKMKMMTAGGAKIKIVPADGVTPFDKDTYNGKKVRVRGVVREFRLDNKYIEGIERERSLLCHVDHTPCLSKSWIEKVRAAGTADSLSEVSTNRLREKVAASGKGYISLVTIEAEQCKVIENAE